ncbi:UdgX family uracil-DNA binding protein [Pacificimonas sp. WHA3]|uniref:UdgX family uracil-DNA binding protein n=1 Tax=Pacificimonas pallii TaxID=2827236 RepID=A0ABS6SH66_9SPHN|nr:UdgX family uracil-DNA binding protein [Pacificimonas pallii]MBV7257691.1 UdgX family uracil-DNA binding protein [Pacificimonas pallii]
MHSARLAHEEDFDGWRSAARQLALGGVHPADIIWQIGDTAQNLFGSEAPPAATAKGDLKVPKAFIDLARNVICHRDPERFALLYTMLLRLQDERGALDDRADPLRKRLHDLRKAVARDIHKMRAFVRFREIDTDGDSRFVAWFEPDHHIVRTNAPFFQRRFANMNWSILTPDLCAHWDTQGLSFTPGATKADAPDGDPVEDTWKTYFASIFNPARVKVKAMTAEMPKKYWKNMPESALIPELIAGARARETVMVDTARQAMVIAGDNRTKSFSALREEAVGCRGCDLWKPATQLVFGEGPVDADLMFLGEQPGDQEDLAGRPFVGPAGRLFDQILREVGIDRTTAYVTNAVKHFKYEQRGKRRIHAKPSGPEIEACRWWADQERDLVQPKITVALGASAARSMLGKVVTITKTRGSPIALPDGSEGWVTVHPSYLLRIPDRAKAEDETARFRDEIAAVKARLAELH